MKIELAMKIEKDQDSRPVWKTDLKATEEQYVWDMSRILETIFPAQIPKSFWEVKILIWMKSAEVVAH